MIIKLKTIIN